MLQWAGVPYLSSFSLKHSLLDKCCILTMPDGLKTGDSAGPVPGIFFFSSTGEWYQFRRGVVFATALEDIYFRAGLLLYNPPTWQIHLTPCFLIQTCTCIRERCKFSNLILLKLIKNVFRMSRQLVNKCTWVCVNFWSWCMFLLHFNSMCFFSLFVTLGV